MKLAPMSYHYVRYPIEKFLDKVERSPFDSIDLYCSAPQLNMFDYPVSRLLELDKSIRRHHLSVMAMTPENCVYPVNFCTQDTLTRESSIRYYQRAIDTAQFLECPAIQISTGFGYFDMPREEAWKFCRESVGTLAAYAERKGVTLLLEELKVTTTNVLITSKDLAKMIAEIDSPAVVGMVDMDQMTYAGETIDDYFANLGDKLQHIHFNDRGHTVPGDADFPMEENYDQIKAHGYEGTCSFEICDRRYYIDPDKGIDDTTRVFTISTTTATICGTSCGIVSAMPLISDSRISAPADTICGSSPTRAEIISVTILAMVGVSSEIAERSPSASALMIPGVLSRTAPAIEVISSANCGISVRIVSITDVTPFFSSSAACSLPARRSASPSVICVIPGKSSPTMRFFRPPAVCESRVRLSSKATEAATASLLITMP